MSKRNKVCEGVKQLTPEIIRGWDKEIEGKVLLVRRVICVYCPLETKLVSEGTCRKCHHNYGMASPREIYCAPGTKKTQGVRAGRREEKRRELTEKETKRVKTLFELGWQKGEIARMVLMSRAEGEVGKMLEAIKEVIPGRHNDGRSERNCSPNSKHQE